MSDIYGMELRYRSLIPIIRPEDTFLSVGTVTFRMEGKELPLDFNITEGSVKGNAGSIICIDSRIKDFEPKVYMDEYEKIGFSPADFTYDFFASRYSDTYLEEVYTEYFYSKSEIFLPLYLESVCLIFQDGSTLDYSNHIRASVQKQLAEVAQ